MERRAIMLEFRNEGWTVDKLPLALGDGGRSLLGLGVGWGRGPVPAGLGRENSLQQ